MVQVSIFQSSLSYVWRRILCQSWWWYLSTSRWSQCLCSTVTVWPFLRSIIWLLFILLRQIDLLLFLQKKDLSTGLTLVAWRRDQLSMIRIWNGQFKIWDRFLLKLIEIHLFTNELVSSNSGTCVTCKLTYICFCTCNCYEILNSLSQIMPISMACTDTILAMKSLTTLFTDHV